MGLSLETVSLQTVLGRRKAYRGDRAGRVSGTVNLGHSDGQEGLTVHAVDPGWLPSQTHEHYQAWLQNQKGGAVNAWGH